MVPRKKTFQGNLQQCTHIPQKSRGRPGCRRDSSPWLSHCLYTEHGWSTVDTHLCLVCWGVPTWWSEAGSLLFAAMYPMLAGIQATMHSPISLLICWSAETAGMCEHAQVSVSQTSIFLHGKRFTHWAISPTLYFFKTFNKTLFFATVSITQQLHNYSCD